MGRRMDMTGVPGYESMAEIERRKKERAKARRLAASAGEETAINDLTDGETSKQVKVAETNGVKATGHEGPVRSLTVPDRNAKKPPISGSSLGKISKKALSRKPIVLTPESNKRREIAVEHGKRAAMRLLHEDNGKFKRTYTVEEIEQLGEEMLAWYTEPEPETGKMRFWLKDFGRNIGVSWNRFLSYRKLSMHFAECLDIAYDLQESRLVEFGLMSGNMPTTTMSIFALKNNCGYTDRKEVGHHGQITHTIETKREKELDAELDSLLAGTGVGKSGIVAGRQTSRITATN